MNKFFSIIKVLVLLGIILPMTSCSDYMTTDSSQYLSADNHNIDSPNDTVFSIVGILAKVGKLTDRTILLGELRADLMDVTPTTTGDLRDISNFTVDNATNTYADTKDYYSVINNCNYFIQKADTSISVRGRKTLSAEVQVAKAIRAWTYLQIGLNFGSAVYYRNPILSTTDLEQVPNELPLEQLIDTLITEVGTIKLLRQVDYPRYDGLNGLSSDISLFINPLILSGDLYLWKASFTRETEYYRAAATKYAEAMVYGNVATSNYANSWTDDTFTRYFNSWTSLFSTSSFELISIFKPASSTYDGVSSSLFSMFNNYELKASANYNNLSNNQDYCFYTTTNNTSKFTKGDLRIKSVLGTMNTNSTDTIITKFSNKVFPIYRAGLLYLRYAEAVNRAGKPGLAFATLKYGLNSKTLDSVFNRVPHKELADKASFVTIFSTVNPLANTLANTGIHSRGSGSSEYNTYYTIPDSASLALLNMDSVEYVENAICDELALETAFEGNRFQDLMRISIRRDNQTKFLAQKVAQKHSDNYNHYFGILSDKKNWFIKSK